MYVYIYQKVFTSWGTDGQLQKIGHGVGVGIRYGNLFTNNLYKDYWWLTYVQQSDAYKQY